MARFSGVLTPRSLGTIRVLEFEMLAFAFLVSGFLSGKWACNTSVILESTMTSMDEKCYMWSVPWAAIILMVTQCACANWGFGNTLARHTQLFAFSYGSVYAKQLCNQTCTYLLTIPLAPLCIVQYMYQYNIHSVPERGCKVQSESSLCVAPILKVPLYHRWTGLDTALKMPITRTVLLVSHCMRKTDLLSYLGFGAPKMCICGDTKETTSLCELLLLWSLWHKRHVLF